MHHAPPVACRVGRSSFEACVLLVICFVTAVVIAADWRHRVLHQLSIQRTLWMLLAWLAAVSWGGLRWLRSPRGVLAYAQGQWLFENEPGSLVVRLDWSNWLLLEWRDQSGDEHFYLWLTQSAHASVWSDIRRALYSAPTITASLP